MKDLESLYDEKIAPLMAQIIEICDEHKLPFCASFQLNDGVDGQDPLFCTSAVTAEGCSQVVVDMINVAQYNHRAIGPNALAALQTYQHICDRIRTDLEFRKGFLEDGKDAV